MRRYGDKDIEELSSKRFGWVHHKFKEAFLKEYGTDVLDPMMKRFSTNMYYRVRTNRDLYISYTGGRGEGKSNLSNLVGFLVDPDFDLEKNVLYTPDEHEVKLKIEYRKIIANGGTPPEGSLPPYSYINIDEAIKVVFKLEQWSGVQRFMKKLFALARTENKIIGMCIPDFLDMGSGFRSQMDFWVDIPFRSYTTVEARSTNKYGQDKWNLKENERRYNKALGRRKSTQINTQEHVNIIKNNSMNYVTSFRFPQLPKVFDDEYNRLKDLHDYGDVGIETKKTRGEKLAERYRLKLMKGCSNLYDKFHNYSKVGRLMGYTGLQAKRFIEELSGVESPEEETKSEEGVIND